MEEFPLSINNPYVIGTVTGIVYTFAVFSQKTRRLPPNRLMRGLNRLEIATAFFYGSLGIAGGLSVGGYFSISNAILDFWALHKYALIILSFIWLLKTIAIFKHAFRIGADRN